MLGTARWAAPLGVGCQADGAWGIGAVFGGRRFLRARRGCGRGRVVRPGAAGCPAWAWPWGWVRGPARRGASPTLGSARAGGAPTAHPCRPGGTSQAVQALGEARLPAATAAGAGGDRPGRGGGRLPAARAEPRLSAAGAGGLLPAAARDGAAHPRLRTPRGRSAAYGGKGTCRGVSARSGWRVRAVHPRSRPIPRRSEDGHPPARPRPTDNRPPYAHPHRTATGRRRHPTRYLPEAFAFAFAAAFASCLYARTFVSDSGPVMSATDRKESASP